MDVDTPVLRVPPQESLPAWPEKYLYEVTFNNNGLDCHRWLQDPNPIKVPIKVQSTGNYVLFYCCEFARWN